jgi:thioredoxin reductase/NAD-dependent dihydropyrimidine dehydrogenase PreA subunit
MDDWIWALALGASLLVVGGYWVVFRRRLKLDRARLEEAQQLGFDKPRGQYPHIDPALCIGCGSCVSVCPEGDVLGMVGGQAVVVNGARCIGIAACEDACPVGAIEVGLGQVKGRADLPVLDEHRQSTVPGLYIAGELGGLSLVRNAIRQGREIVHHIADQASTGGDARALDLLVVGAGPAGLSAALAATERGLDYTVVEQEESFGGTVMHYPRRKLVHTQPIELPLGGNLAPGEHLKEDMLALFEDLYRRFGLNIDFSRKVTSIRKQDGLFEVDSVGGSYRARNVLLALGRRGTPRRLGVPGEELGKVMYQVRDAAEYQNQRILCVGGGDSAVEAAMGLGRQPGNEVWISYRRERFGRIKRRNDERLGAEVEAGRVRLLLPSTVREIHETSVVLESAGATRSLTNDYVFVFAGGEPPYPLLREAGVLFGVDIN